MILRLVDASKVDLEQMRNAKSLAWHSIAKQPEIQYFNEQWTTSLQKKKKKKFSN